MVVWIKEDGIFINLDRSSSVLPYNVGEAPNIKYTVLINTGGGTKQVVFTNPQEQADYIKAIEELITPKEYSKVFKKFLP